MLYKVLCLAFIGICVVSISLAWVISSFFNSASRNPVIIEGTKTLLYVAIATLEVLALVMFIYLILTLGKI
ncbi:hypothetical protein AB836_00900 [Rickettsiales bacterium (ex Bugula neritina AB1)]|nr:hypothetical protein AB836_00900 [Rickettsiales bacterium (ex Bugula neritina AB1)]